MNLAHDFIQISVVTTPDGKETIIGLKSDGTVWRKQIAPYMLTWEQI